MYRLAFSVPTKICVPQIFNTSLSYHSTPALKYIILIQNTEYLYILSLYNTECIILITYTESKKHIYEHQVLLHSYEYIHLHTF